MDSQPRALVRRPSPYPFATHGIRRDSDGVAHYENLPRSLVEVLRHWAETTPESDAVSEVGGPRLSYRELHERAARVAGGLRAAGVNAGDRVALRYPAGARWVLAFWGTLLAGAVPVAVNTRFTPHEVSFVLQDADVAIDLTPDTPLPDGDPVVASDPGPDDVAAIFYTSGTTGHPKGVPTTHEAFLSNAETMLRGLGVTRDIGAELRTLISVPLFHVTGCNSQLLTAAYAGGAAVILPTLDLKALLDAVHGERISFLVTVPAVYALLLRDPAFTDADTSTVRWVGYGGAPIASSQVHALRAAFPGCDVFNGYGMTETASLMTVLPNAEAAEHADSVGYAVPVVDLAIAPLDHPNRGELLARGPNVMRGYWRHPEATEQALQDGWMRTGDIVEVDAEGRVVVVDRLKDIINRGGENISSVEVENALSEAPGVAEVAVVGVPDDVMGEKVGAVLVPTGIGPDSRAALDVDAVLAHARTRLADYKMPQYVSVITGPLPRNAGGKVRKNEVRRTATWRSTKS
ncbi:class I adenylate-forming enzyme family protein [Streptomyces sp. NPDC101234]|uniref:class I adenylate-forming enzyme family protein n=1 Tax=Streptomyces sp. NPDC101234 TaxID=3366138 RepID=UPI003802F3C6